MTQSVGVAQSNVSTPCPHSRHGHKCLRAGAGTMTQSVGFGSEQRLCNPPPDMAPSRCRKGALQSGVCCLAAWESPAASQSHPFVLSVGVAFRLHCLSRRVSFLLPVGVAFRLCCLLALRFVCEKDRAGHRLYIQEFGCHAIVIVVTVIFRSREEYTACLKRLCWRATSAFSSWLCRGYVFRTFGIPISRFPSGCIVQCVFGVCHRGYVDGSGCIAVEVLFFSGGKGVRRNSMEPGQRRVWCRKERPRGGMPREEVLGMRLRLQCSQAWIFGDRS